MFSLALAALTSFAHAAAPDLTTSITAPAGAYVYQSAMWQVTVTNGGNKDAGAVTTTIQLPVTHTSPTVYTMGTVGAKSSTCSLSGTKITCTAASLKRSKSTTFYFYMSLPQSASAETFTATASTSGETNTSNNGSSSTAALNMYSPSFTGAVTVTNRHCTGLGLTAFYECEVSPGSISSHTAVFNADGSVSIPVAPSYTGSWSVSGSQLTFDYDDGTGIVAEFVGDGVDGNCWEGLTTFPLSSYVSPYEVCM